MNRIFTNLLVPAAFLFSAPLIMAGGEAMDERAGIEVQALLEETEKARQEAELARENAVRAAEMAREAARMNAEMAREEALMEAEMARMEAEIARMESEENRIEAAELTKERARQREEQARERALQQEELAMAREELGRAHRELSEATREVARAHRDLSRSNQRHRAVRHVNLGDRAVIGVVLGKESEKGIELIGVSPDGPAERAGLKQGDVLISIQGVDLAGADASARKSIYEVMSETADGEELAVIVERNGEPLDFTVTAEHREPRGWQSVIRIPDVPMVEGAPGEPHLVVETIEIPDIDHEALAARIEELTESLEARKFLYASPDTEDLEHWALQFDGEFSDFGEHALREANIWFGMPRTQGLELTPINEGLGDYFKTDRGVLVIKAREDNAYQLESGDVILEIDSHEVDSPSDMMRVLREVQPGSEIDISIKRKRRDKTLTIVVPENRLGLRYRADGLHH